MGPETADDAGVFLLDEHRALVETTDIITPLVDDPFDFGRIAAANAISDVYAMGGTPLTVMNLVFFPACALPPDVLRRILAGGQEVIREAGACLVGGHTVEDEELKYGLAVTGIVDPERIVRNSTARPGDRLVLTKPLGTGIISTAIKAEMVSQEVASEAVRWMTTLNRQAAELMVACGASAATDVTGFGLVGHACEMARGAGVTMRLYRGKIEFMKHVTTLVRDGLVPAGCYRNRDFYAPLTAGKDIAADASLPLFDPQTSGGLLIAMSPEDAGSFLAQAGAAGCWAVPVGEVASFSGSLVEID